jgi:hypothetical protein
MGMYDIITGEFYCPFCQAKLTEMQTKFFDERGLDEITLAEFEQTLQEIANTSGKYIVGEMHDCCEKCGRFVSINIAVSPYDIKG